MRIGETSRLVLAAMVAVLGAGRLAAQGGQLDPSFGVGGKLTADFIHGTDIANALALQPDGKLVAVGQTYTDNDYSKEDFAVLRFGANGAPDATFGANGRVTTNFPNLAAVASSVVVQPDGKILVAGGAFPQFTFLGDFKIVRYEADGALDASFGAGGIVTSSFPGQGSYAFALALQPDGKIVAAGTDFVNFSTEASSNTDFAIARYNADGTPDATFGNGGQVTTDFNGFNDDVFAIVVQPDGRLIAVGSALSQITSYDFAAVRYLPDGTVDSSFGVGGKARTDFVPVGFDQARAAALQPDGRLVVAGFTNFNGGLSQPFALARYDSHGVLDGSFDGDGKLSVDFGSFNQTAYDVLVQPDGKIVATGYPNTESSDSDFLLARCNPDGSLDAGFGVGGKVRTSFGNLNGGAYGAVLQPDGRIAAAGFIATPSHLGVEFALARYLGGSEGWTDLGGALAGGPGLPVLFGTGPLTAGSNASLVLTNAHASALAVLFVALTSSPAPFKGGTLVPAPPLLAAPLATSAAGTLALPFAWPAGLPSGLVSFYQYAIQDAAAVHGVALSNALKSMTP